MTFSPRFQSTPRLLKILEDSSALKERIQNQGVGVRWVPALQREALARQAHGSTAIEGNPLTLKEVQALAEGKELPHAKPRAVQEVLNYFAALRFVEKQRSANKITVRDVLKLHSIIGRKNALDREPIGLYRPYGVRVGNHVAPPPKAVPKLMSELLDWVNGPGRAWPAVISSGILHYQFENIHPFGDGNGRAGRALATWELYRRRFDTHHIFAVDEVLLEDRPRYYKALQRVRDEDGDMTGWLEFIAEATREALERAWKRLEAVGAGRKSAQIILTPKQEKLLALLREGPLGVKEIQRNLKVTKPGAHHILKPLLKAGLIQRQGGHKTGKYSLT